MTSRKLCLVIPSLQAGGMERVMSELAGYFCSKANVEVHLVLYGRLPEIFYKVPDRLIIYKPESAFNNRLRQISTLRRMWFLRRTIGEINPDSILSFGEYWNSFVLLALLGGRYSVFVSDRCRPDKQLGFLHQMLRKFLYPKASGIVVQTSKAKDIYERLLNRLPIKVIGNPIREISPSNEVIKENIVLTVGRIIPTKNHAGLIESFIRINKSGWKLLIVGGDALNMTLSRNLKDLVRSHNAEDKIIIVGNSNDVDMFYRMSRIFVLTSESEGFPNVIGEAMSSGLPVVAFDCVAGPSEMIADGRDGFLVPLYNYKLLEEKLSVLMNEPDLREQIGSEASKSIRDFSLSRIGEEYFSFITSTS